MKFIAVAVALGVLSAAVPAAAQETDDQLPFVQYTMNDELVTSTLLRPDVDPIFSAGRRPTISLIKIRLNFVQEMLKSAENL